MTIWIYSHPRTLAEFVRIQRHNDNFYIFKIAIIVTMFDFYKWGKYAMHIYTLHTINITVGFHQCANFLGERPDQIVAEKEGDDFRHIDVLLRF